jgi:predicted porin
MFGGVGKSAGWATILVAGGLALGSSVPAQAADFGGDCCADLEERIAELEATTARKGNRKVSLQLYGWVNEAVMFWDDGTEQNVYIGTNTLEQTRFGFKGEAKINAEWSAGYKIEIGVASGGFSGYTQASDEGSNGFTVRKSYWFLKSKKLGTVAVGQNGTASYHAVDDADFTSTRNVSDFEAAAAYMGSFTANPSGVRWKDILRGWNNATPGQSSRRKVVRYDSPTFAGFAVSAAWGEDDMWDVGLDYSGDIGDFKIAAKAGYGESRDDANTSCGGPTANFDCKWFGTGATVMHMPTGLYVFAGYGWQQIDSLAAGAGVDDTSETWLIQPGIEKKWMPLGKTTIFGEYRHDQAGTNENSAGGVVNYGGDIDFWAAGVVQNVESAAMDLYVMYRHAEGDYITNAAGAKASLDDFDMVISGARIQF